MYNFEANAGMNINLKISDSKVGNVSAKVGITQTHFNNQKFKKEARGKCKYEGCRFTECFLEEMFISSVQEIKYVC